MLIYSFLYSFSSPKKRLFRWGKMKKNFFGLITVVLVLFLAPFASAITGSIGNAKAIVTVDLKKSNVLERTVLVRNVNNVSVTVKLEAADDLEGITDILDKEFTLEPNQEKNARFTATIPKEGTYNGNIVIFFKPPEGKGAGVALQANLIIKATGQSSSSSTPKNDSKSIFSDLFSNKNNNEATGSTVIDNKEDSVFSPAIILFLVLIAIVIISVLIFIMRMV